MTRVLALRLLRLVIDSSMRVWCVVYVYVCGHYQFMRVSAADSVRTFGGEGRIGLQAGTDRAMDTLNICLTSGRLQGRTALPAETPRQSSSCYIRIDCNCVTVHVRNVVCKHYYGWGSHGPRTSPAEWGRARLSRYAIALHIHAYALHCNVHQSYTTFVRNTRASGPCDLFNR